MTDEDTTGTGEATPQERGSAPTRAQRRAAEEQSGQREPRFSLERLRGPDGAAVVEGAFAAAGQDAPPGAFVALASGLDDVDEDGLTRAQIRQRVGAFHAHEDTTGQEA